MRWRWVCDWGKEGVKVEVGLVAIRREGFYGSINFLACLLEL